MSTEHLTHFINRRSFLNRAWNGIGALGLANLLKEDLLGNQSSVRPLSPKRPHLPRKAKHCIFLFMQGGVSQMDSFEYRPRLRELHGKPIPKVPNIHGELQGRLSFPHVCIGSQFEFQRYGQTGRYLSELFPHLSQHVDDLAFIHGIKTDNQNHGPSTYHVNTGSEFPGSPSIGSWVQYGLGSLNQNMPGYVVIQDPRGAPVNGAAIWANGYLPAAHQGTLLRPNGVPILNLERPQNTSAQDQRAELNLLNRLNHEHLQGRANQSDLEARIASYELAFRMQTAAPEIVDIGDEPDSVRKLYGLDDQKTAGFGRQCLLARRLVERGVRYSLLVHGVQIGKHSWDDHGDVGGGMIRHCGEVDRPVAGLLEDLKRTGLLDETLVVWASEMGRTPFRNATTVGKTPGREHNSYGLCMWMAGGNVKPGATAGKTDEYSLRSVGAPIHIRDVHATILDLMGLEDQKLTYTHAGRIRKLTDIGGDVLHKLIA